MDFKNQRTTREPSTRINEWIKAPRVLLVDDGKGNTLGEIGTDQARIMATDLQLDLVEVGQSGTTPVCKIMNYSKYIYEQKKKQRKNKGGKAKGLKEFKFSPVIDTGDANTRVRRAKEFLDKGHPVKITVFKKGRQPYEKMKEVFSEILTNFTEYSTIDPEPKSEFNSISVTFKKNVTSKNKQNSIKENQAIQPKGEQESKDDVQTESPGTSKD